MEPVLKGHAARTRRAFRALPQAALALQAQSAGRCAADAVQRRTNAAPARIEGLDGLRALAVIVVLLGHAARGKNAPSLLWPLRDLGIDGVFLFFGISGFIITLLMLKERQRSGSVNLAAFWKRRALRILPPFAVSCAGIGLAAAFGLMAWHWHSLFSALSFTINFHLFDGDWFFGHFWSLSVEQQFYLFWPLLFLLLMRRSRASPVLLALILASPVLALCGLMLIPPTLLNVTPCIPYLSVGCLLAILLHTRERRFSALLKRQGWRRAALWLLPLGAIAASCFKRDGHSLLLATAIEAIAMPFAVLVLLAESVTEDGLLRSAMSFAPLRWVGVASYSMYLWQQMFLGPPEVYRSEWFWTEWPQNILAAAACGTLAYLLVERPVAGLKKRIDHGAGKQRAASGALRLPHRS